MPDKTNLNNSPSRKIHASLKNKKTDRALSYNDNETTIDLYGLLFSIWRYKLIIILVTCICSILSYIYASNLENIYRVQAFLLPPKFSNDGKNTQNKINIRVDNLVINYRDSFSGIYKTFKQNLKSRRMQKKFLLESGLIEQFRPKSMEKTNDIEIFEDFFSMIHIQEDEFFTVSIESNDPIFSAKIINDFVKFINKETVDYQIEHVKKSIKEKILDIEYAIASKRKMAKRRREDQILRFQEAKIIASSLGFERRVDATNIIQSTNKASSDRTSATTPLYYIGTEALSAEIGILENRISDDPFIHGLRDLQETLGFLRTINMDKISLNAVFVDQKAFPTKNPIKPNRKFIFSFGTTIGLFFGIILTMIFLMIKKNFELFENRNN